MIEKKFCTDCHQKHRCQDIYQQLGSSKQPPVTLKVILVFLFPIIIFICSLMVFEKALLAMGCSDISFGLRGDIFDGKMLITLISFLFSVLTTYIFVCVVRLISKKLQ